jgi:excalibur calcium-binding domain-containing protein
MTRLSLGGPSAGPRWLGADCGERLGDPHFGHHDQRIGSLRKVERPMAGCRTSALVSSFYLPPEKRSLMLNKIVRGVLIGSLVLAGTTAVAAVPAEAAAKKYKNCTALNKVYKHGVGKKGAKDKVRGTTKKVTTFKVSNALYQANKKMDRDKDGIACEKR